MGKVDNINYHEFVGQDIISMMMSKLGSHEWAINQEGKIARTHEPMLSTESPWYHVMHYPDCRCDTYHFTIFNTIMPSLPKDQWFVPSRCLNCWKVVVRPNTLKELFALLRLQERMNVPSKCGFEGRESVRGSWGGYFYTASLDEGLERYEQVRAGVDECIGTDCKVLLKRACTEFELAMPDSRKWKITPLQEKIEALVAEKIDESRSLEQTDIQRIHVIRKWIEAAYSLGEDVTEWTDGKELYPDYVTYHHLLGKSDEEKEAYFAEATDA